MILKKSYTAARILEIKNQTGADPSIIERTLFAFGLLEALKNVGLPFIFKGGTSLLIILDKPRRLSTDIDIIVDIGIDVDEYIIRAGNIFPFVNVEEQWRKGVNAIEKRYFRFYFISPTTGREINILLDVVFENNPYPYIHEKPIKSKLLLCGDKDTFVTIPDKNCMLGDKLTAFAPHTIGIPFGVDKELEIIKQMFDCRSLLLEMDDYKAVSETYRKVSKLESDYRGLDKKPEDCLKDTIDSCICIMGRGSIRQEEYRLFYKGISAIQDHIIEGRFNGESACEYAGEIMYLATCLLTGVDSYERISEPEEYRDTVIRLKGIKKISGIRNTSPQAYAYTIKSFQMLQESGLYADGI